MSDMENHFTLNNIENIEIDGVMFNVFIEGQSRNDVSGKIITSDNNQTLKYKQTGATLNIWYKRPFFPFPSFKRNTLFLDVPELTNITVKNTSGCIKVSNLLSKNKVVLNTSSGSITCEKITADIRVGSSSGKQYYKNISGAIEANASSGDISLETLDGKSNIKTTSGKITGKNVTLTGDTNITSTTGNISIKLCNHINDLTFDLKASSGSLEVGSDKSNKRLRSGNGSIKIIGRTTSGNQKYT